MFAAAESQTSTDADGDKASLVASSNADAHASAAAAAAETALSEFSAQLTAKILELLCDESVSYLLIVV